MTVNVPNNAPPLSTSVDTAPMGLRLSLPWSLWFNWLYTFVKDKVDYSNAAVYAALTGFSYTLGNTQTLLTINPAGTLATGTVVMPATPYDGMPIEISSTQIITSFTLSDGVHTIKNAPTSLSAGVGIAYYYNAASSTWFRRY